MSSSRVATPVGRLLERGTWTGQPDGRLLDRYARLGDPEAFEALASRHGPMVMGVCRRILVEPSDVDDAFQATFLVLIRRASSLGPGDVLSAWLHGVATKVARRARMDRARRRARERDGLGVEPRHEPIPPDFALRGVIDEEVERLPWKYRAPVALCYLEGLTHEEVAARLGWPVGSVKGRLARARALLGSRLARRGVTAGAGALALEGLASAAATDTQVSAVALAAGRVAAGVAWKSVLSCPVIKLARGACAPMIATKLTAAALAATAIIAAAGVGVAVARSGGQEPTSPPPHRQQAEAEKTDQRPGSAAPGSTSLQKAETPASSPAFHDFNAAGDSNPKTAAVLKKLDEPVAMNFPNETPLEDILKYIQQVVEGEGGIPIYVEPVGLSQADRTLTSPISIDLAGVPLRRTLQLVLKQLDLVYYVEDGILVITSKEAAEAGLGPDVARPSPLQVEMEKADRGELTLEEMQALAQKLKLIAEIRKLREAEEGGQARAAAQ